MSTKSNLYFKHLKQFMDRCQLWPTSGRVLAAVSGGPDSMALAHMLANFKKQKLISELIILHVDHGARAESQKEGLMVKAWAQSEGLPFILKELKLELNRGNFEATARSERYLFFKKHLQPGDRLATGHHLNDSWEWSLMQSFRSGDFKKSLGIPVKRGDFIRPLMCLSRRQLMKYIQRHEISCVQDQSNFNPRFERNYLRMKVMSPILERYPQALAHYVHQKNDLARMLGCSAWKGVNAEIQWEVRRDLEGWQLWARDKRKNLDGAQRLLQEGIQSLSSQHRGRIKGEIEKICTKARDFKGPHSFSGGVKLVRDGHIFYLYREK